MFDSFNRISEHISLFLEEYKSFGETMFHDVPQCSTIIHPELDVVLYYLLIMDICIQNVNYNCHKTYEINKNKTYSNLNI